jgi:ribosome-associated protein
MWDMSDLRVDQHLSLPAGELEYRATRAGGPGGQHVNTSATRIELLWNLERSAAVTDEQRERLRRKLAARLDAEGRVRVVASASRSQRQNRAAAAERLAGLVRDALKVRKRRKPTAPSRAAKERRLTEKRRTSERKRARRKPLGDD